MHTETEKKLFFRFLNCCSFILSSFYLRRRNFFSSVPLHVVIPSMPMHILLYNKIGRRNIVTEYSLNIEICAYKQQRSGEGRDGCGYDALVF